jgi:hypothetical protein
MSMLTVLDGFRRPGRSRKALSRRVALSFAVLLLLLVPSLSATPADGVQGGPAPSPGSGVATAHTETSMMPTGDAQLPSHRGTIVPIGRTELHGIASPTRGTGAPEWMRHFLLGTDPLRPAAGGGPPAPVVDGNFSVTPSGPSQLLNGPGFQGVDNSQCGCTPPDVQDAAGPYDVVEMVNLYIEVWNHQGTAIGGESLGTFYGTSGFLSDPRIIYDNLSGRYFASILTATASTGYVYFAVSDNSSASGNWTVYKILSAGAALPDQPIIGVNATLIGLGVNIFSSSFNGAAEYWVVNKSEVLQGLSTTYVAFGPDASSFSVHPDRTIDPSAPLYFVESLPGSPGTLEIFRVSGAPPGPTTVARTNLSVGNIDLPPPAPTPGGGYVDSGSFRIADAIERSGRLYITFGDKCSAGGANRSCVRYDVVNTTPSLSVDQDFDVAHTAMYLYYPALSLDPAGNAVLVFGVASSTLYPSVAAATHRTTDPPTWISPFVWLHRGTAGFAASCSPSCRFGDYFGSGADPNGATVWVSGEYLTNTTMWQSWLAPVQSVGTTVVNLSGPTEADIGHPFDLTLNVTPAPCGPGWTDWCTAQVPLENGSTAQVACGSFGGPLSISDVFTIAGSYPIGTGGNVSVYNDSSCTAGNLTVRFPLSPTTVTVFRSPTASLSDSNGGVGDIGQSVRFTASPRFGAPPFSYQWLGLPNGCLSANTSTLACIPVAAGTFPVQVVVDDGAGNPVSVVSPYIVNTDPSFSLNASASRADVGMNISFAGGASGGTGPYAFEWHDLPPGCTPLTVAFQTCVLSSSGIYYVTFGGNDSAGFPGLSPVFEVDVAPALSVRLVGSPDPLQAGAPTILTASSSGGFDPLTWQWSGLPAGCPVPSEATLTCTFPTGSYRIDVTAVDSVGGTASANLSGSIASPGAAASDTTDLLYVGFGSAVLLLAIAVGVVLLRSRRRREDPP